MRDLVIMPAMAQRRESLNIGEFAEEAIIVEEVTAPKRVNHFIEANTQEVTLQHLNKTASFQVLHQWKKPLATNPL